MKVAHAYFYRAKAVALIRGDLRWCHHAIGEGVGLRGSKRIGVLALMAGMVWTVPQVHALQDVRFRAPGASEDLDKRLRNASLLLESESQTDDIQEVLAAARAEYARLLSVLYAEGHFGGVINILVDGREASSLSPLTPPSSIHRIEVTVQPGPLYTFSRAAVQPLATDTALPPEFKVGETAKVPAIRKAVDASVDGWRDEGYAMARVSGQDIVARHVEKTVAASIAVDTGPQVTFGKFSVQGNKAVREDAIRRIAGFPEGERFSPERMELSAKRLRNTGAFRSVAFVEPDTLQQGAVMPVMTTVSEEAPRRLSFGGEIDTSEGLGLNAYWLHRNLLGGAESLRIEGDVTGIGGDSGGADFTFGTTFVRPATPNPDTSLTLKLEVAHEDERDYTSDSIKIGASFSREVGDRFKIDYGLGLDYSRDDDDRGVTQYSLLTFPVHASSDQRDDPLNPTRGWYAEAGVEPFVGLNRDSGAGARLTFDGRAYRGFGEDNRFVAAARVQLGSIAMADLTDVPNDFRFYSGGGGTVRGHEYEILGVTLDDDVKSGGGSFFGVSGEARVGVTENIQGVAFVDYGYVAEGSYWDGNSGDHIGAGFGVRYLTPIGPIRLDLAVPVSGDSDSSFQLYVGIGQAF